jgi:hypothetical protein
MVFRERCFRDDGIDRRAADRLAASRLISGMLFGVAANDPSTIAERRRHWRAAALADFSCLAGVAST